MPIYEYYCADCRRKVSVFFRSFAAIGDPVCPLCGGSNLERRFSRVVVRRGGPATTTNEEPDLDAFGDEAYDDGFGPDDGDDFPFGPDDDADPREIAQWTRQMSAELGEPLDPKLDAALSEMERGADPDEVLERFGEDDDEGGPLPE